MELHLIRLDTDLDLLKNYPALQRYLTYEEVQSCTRIHYRKDRNIKVVSRVGLKYLLAEKLSLPLEEVNIKYHPYGKPYMENASIEFNLSHSENTILYGFDDHTLGIDIEKMNPIIPETAEFFMSSGEFNHFTSLKDKQAQKEFFYEIWTAKESLFKATGTGITDIIRTITIPFDKHSENEMGRVIRQNVFKQNTDFIIYRKVERNTLYFLRDLLQSMLPTNISRVRDSLKKQLKQAIKLRRQGVMNLVPIFL